MTLPHPFGQTPALVTRPLLRPRDPDQYLLLTPRGALWTTDPVAATPFESMREATRAAARLPAVLRAFGLPRASELHAALH
jgi:hypothetical protein